MLEGKALAILVPVAALAGFIRGFSGFGGPLIMLPILGLYLAPAEAVWVMMWVDILVNVRLVPEARRDLSARVFLPLLAGTVATMPIGLWLLTTIDAVLMKRVLCVAILIAALVLLSGWRYRGEATKATWLGIGGLSGVVMGATSLAVTVALFLNAGRQTAAEARANFIVWVFATTLVYIAMLTWQRAAATGQLGTILVLAPVYVLAATLGASVQRAADEALVRRLVLMLVVVIALMGLVLS